VYAIHFVADKPAHIPDIDRLRITEFKYGRCVISFWPGEIMSVKRFLSGNGYHFAWPTNSASSFFLAYPTLS
jgi:hypothetical protein